MKYDDLYDTWLGARQKPLPPRFKDIATRGSLKAQLLSADDNRLISNSFSPYDLYNNPNDTPNVSDGGYGTSAYQMHDDQGLGVKDLISIITRGSKNNLETSFPVQSTVGQYKDIPKELHSYIPQGQYEHEKSHYERPYMRNKNVGYMTRLGMPGDVGFEESRAMRGEDRMWDTLMSTLAKRRKQS